MIMVIIEHWLDRWGAGIVAWLWRWAQCLSYWIAAIGGTGSFLLYVVTKERKFATFTAAIIILYIMIAATGAAT